MSAPSKGAAAAARPEHEQSMNPEEIAMFLDRLTDDLGHIPSPQDVVDRMLNPVDDFEKRARLSFRAASMAPEDALAEMLRMDARRFIERAAPRQVIVENVKIQVPYLVSDPDRRLSGGPSYVNPVAADGGGLAVSAEGPAIREACRELLGRIDRRELVLRHTGVWELAVAFRDGLVKAADQFAEREQATQLDTAD